MVERTAALVRLKRKDGTVEDFEVKPGDVYASSGTGAISNIIKIASWSPYSHVGVVCDVTREWGKGLYLSDFQADLLARGMWVFESTALRRIPCAFHQEVRQGTQMHDVREVLLDSVKDMFHLYRPTKMVVVEDLRRYLAKQMEKGFDFPGAVKSAMSSMRFILGRRSDLLFCTELVNEALWTAGAIPKDTGLWTPGRWLKDNVDRNHLQLMGEILV